MRIISSVVVLELVVMVVVVVVDQSGALIMKRLQLREKHTFLTADLSHRFSEKEEF